MTTDNECKKALASNSFIHSYMIAIIHALLWIAALSIAAFFHLCPEFSHAEALLYSTLSAYGAYLCESVLSMVNAMSQSTEYDLNFRRAGLWGWILLNLCCNILWSFLFLKYQSWIFLILIILTAGWQKYMDGRVPVRLMSTRKPL